MSAAASDIDSRLQALLTAGAPERAPVRWHQLQSLMRRLPTLPPDVAQQLEVAVERTLLACERDLVPSSVRSPAPSPSPAQARHAPLAALNAHLRQQHEHTARAAALAGEAVDPAELASLRRFRASWSRIAAEDQVAQAITRTPDNAGPLNSHALVLRSLALMRDISPDYLRRFLEQLDALLWLEDVALRPATTKPTKVDKHAKAPRAPAGVKQTRGQA